MTQILADSNLLASGSQAKVIDGKISSGIPIAIKLFPNTQKGHNSFIEEAKIISKIRDTTKIVQIVSISYSECTITMKRYDCDLFAYCFEDGRVSGEIDSKKVLKEICKSLQALHSSGVAHLDIKPENVLVDLHSKKFHLCDFGLSYHSVDNDRNEMVECICKIGTEQYIAPEIIQNSPYNPFSADIYSIGCLFYSMLTGFFFDYLGGESILFPDGVQISPQGKAFLAQLLATNPEKRPTIEQILSSPYLKRENQIFQKFAKKAISLTKVVYK